MSGKAQVEHDQVGTLAASRGDGGGAVVGRRHAKARLLKVVTRQFDDLGFVVHDQYQFVHWWVLYGISDRDKRDTYTSYVDDI